VGRSFRSRCPLVALSGHWLSHRTCLVLTQSGHRALRRVRIHRVAGPTPSSIHQVAILQLVEVILATVLDPNDMLVLIRTRLCSLLGVQ
jgi:hypothetical protein